MSPHNLALSWLVLNLWAKLPSAIPLSLQKEYPVSKELPPSLDSLYPNSV